jgi:two-component system KDP operon response regulator KdpE
MKSESPVILIVDDEPEYVRILQSNLQARSYEVVTASSGPQALKAFDEEYIDLVLLDIMLPGLDGFQVCRSIREKSGSVGIIMLSALYKTEIDKVEGLDLGADDYLTKPFGIDEFLARVRTLLRRRSKASMLSSRRLAFGACEFDPDVRRVFFDDGVEERLTPKEYGLLRVLVENAGKVVTHRTLLTTVWGPEYQNEEHYLWTYIRRLRSKLRDNPNEPELLFTEHGLGYRFTADVSRN